MSEHIVSRKTYTIVFGILLLLLVLSVWAAQYDLGSLNTVIALGISAAKAVLIVLFFMHVCFSSALVRLISISGLLWLVLMLVLVMSDYETRSWMTPRGWADYQAKTLDRVEVNPAR